MSKLGREGKQSHYLPSGESDSMKAIVVVGDRLKKSLLGLNEKLEHTYGSIKREMLRISITVRNSNTCVFYEVGGCASPFVISIFVSSESLDAFEENAWFW